MDLKSAESTLACIENILDGAARQSRNRLIAACAIYLDLENGEANLGRVEFEKRCAEAISLEELLITTPVLGAGGTQREADSLIEHLYATAAYLYQQTANENRIEVFEKVLRLIEENITYSPTQASLPELLKTSTGNCEAVMQYTLMILRILSPSLLLRIQIIAPNGKRGYSGNKHMRVAWAVPDDPYSFWTADPLGSGLDGEPCHIERLSQAPLMDVPAEYLLLKNALKKAGYDVPEDPWVDDRVDYEQQEKPPSSGGLEIQGGEEPVDKDMTMPPEALKPPQKRGKKMLFSDLKMPTRVRLITSRVFKIITLSLVVHGSIDAIIDTTKEVVGAVSPHETEIEPIRMVTLVNGIQIANALDATGVSDKAILPDENNLKREKLAELQKAAQKLKSTRKETIGRMPGFLEWLVPIVQFFSPSLDSSLQELLDKGKSQIDLLSLEKLDQAIVKAHEAEQFYRTNVSKALPWIFRVEFLTSAILLLFIIGKSLLKYKQRQNSLSNSK